MVQGVTHFHKFKYDHYYNDTTGSKKKQFNIQYYVYYYEHIEYIRVRRRYIRVIIIICILKQYHDVCVASTHNMTEIIICIILNATT